MRCEELEEESRFVRADAEKKVAQANAAAHEEATKGRASEEVIRSLLAQVRPFFHVCASLVQFLWAPYAGCPRKKVSVEGHQWTPLKKISLTCVLRVGKDVIDGS